MQNARDDALAAERIRQQGYDRETDALNAQSQDRYQGFEGQQDQKATELGDYFQSQADSVAATPDTVGAGALLPASNSAITVANEAGARGKARAYTDQQGAALGNLRSFGDLLGGIGREQARDAISIGQIGGFKKGSSSVLHYELEAAN